MIYRGSLQESPLNNSEISKRFLPRNKSAARERLKQKIKYRLVGLNFPLSELSTVSRALYPPHQHLSTKYVLGQYKVSTPDIILRSRFISPLAPPVSNIQLHDFVFCTICPAYQFEKDGIYQIRLFKPEDSIALVRYMYTHEVAPIVVSLLGLGMGRFIEEEEDLKPNSDRIVFFLIQTKTERELDEVGVRIIAFCRAVESLKMHGDDIWGAINPAWSLLLHVNSIPEFISSSLEMAVANRTNNWLGDP
ncbi:hypothetical protein ARMGADRAFT_1087553 [Armillaria gallica]|uniref:Uncharacterized protein n=1 Tax=Armillaria gallica TaxID=47427 RepID=A0A2H3DD20_ARMGA|nr:hypothetical protein ARMGADRAFT_1087553 [Armillaria gallica]